MSNVTRITVPSLLLANKPMPEGFASDPDVAIEWTADIKINLASSRYQGITFYKGEKVIRLSMDEVEKRLGLEW